MKQNNNIIFSKAIKFDILICLNVFKDANATCMPKSYPEFMPTRIKKHSLDNVFRALALGM